MKTVKYLDDNGNEVELSLPSKKEVCSRCNGEGKILHPSIGEHAYTSEEFNDEFDDESREHYFTRGGMYDVECPRCEGHNVMDTIDEDNIPDDMKVAYDEYIDHLNANERYEAERPYELMIEY